MNDLADGGFGYILPLLFCGFLAMTNQVEHFLKDAEDDLPGVVIKFSDRKSRVSVIGYCPNASPLLNHLTIRRNAPHLSLI